MRRPLRQNLRGRQCADRNWKPETYPDSDASNTSEVRRGKRRTTPNFTAPNGRRTAQARGKLGGYRGGTGSLASSGLGPVFIRRTHDLIVRNRMHCALSSTGVLAKIAQNGDEFTQRGVLGIRGGQSPTA